jgi:hypothetical protein
MFGKVLGQRLEALQVLEGLKEGLGRRGVNLGRCHWLGFCDRRVFLGCRWFQSHGGKKNSIFFFDGTTGGFRLGPGRGLRERGLGFRSQLLL